MGTVHRLASHTKHPSLIIMKVFVALVSALAAVASGFPTPAAPLAAVGYAGHGAVVGAPAVAGVPGVRQTVQLTPGHATFTRVYNLPGEAELLV